MTSIARALSTALIHFVWQAAVVAALLWVALFLMRKRSANARYLASCLAMAALAALPALTTWILYSPALAVARYAQAAEPIEAAATITPIGPVASPWLAALLPWTLPVWSFGVLFFSLRMTWGCRQVAVLRRRGESASPAVLAAVANVAARLGLDRPVRVLTTAASGPSVVGWIRPVILLPSATLLGLTPEQLESVLAHELAHIRRHDYLVNMAQNLVEALLFYHPAVWWTSARIRHERELCCDDLAVSSCGDAVCYARALTTLERLRLTTPSLALGSTGGSMLYRVRRLVGAGTAEYGPSKLSGILALALGLACFAANLHWAQAQSQEPQTGERHNYLFLVSQNDRAGVHVDLGGAQVLHRTSVEYPGSALEKGIQGTVVVEATLDASGAVSDAHVVAGPPELRRISLQSVLQWHFAPEAAGSTRQVSITFRADEARERENAEPRTVAEGGYTVTYQAREGERKRAKSKQEPSSRSEGARLEAESALLHAQNERMEAVLRETQANESANQERLQEMSALQAQLQAFESQRASAEGEPSSERRGRIMQLRAQLAELQAQTEAGLHQSQEEQARRRVSGRTLRSIDVVGLSDAMQAELLGRLNLHVGDTLAPNAVETIAKTVRSFDEHLQVRLAQAEEGDGMALRITAPNFGVSLELRRK